MMSSSRCLGGVTRPRDLRALTRSIRVHPALSPETEHVAGPSRSSDLAQALPGSNSGRMFKDPTQAEALLPEITPAPPTTEAPLCPSAQLHIDPSLLAHPAPQLSFASQQTRGFHTSSRVPYDSTSYNATDVPDFFVKYKQHRVPSSPISEIKHAEMGLMPSLTQSILSGDVIASTRRLKAKIPVEHHAAEGHIVHPSGFVVPGPGHTSTSDVARAKEKERNENKDRLVQTAAVANRVLESDFEQVDATTVPSSHKVPFEVRELDGTVKHPSGFMPPTPAHKFRHTVNSNVLWERKVTAVRQKPRQASPSRAVLRALHTASKMDTAKRI